MDMHAKNRGKNKYKYFFGGSQVHTQLSSLSYSAEYDYGEDLCGDKDFASARVQPWK